MIEQQLSDRMRAAVLDEPPLGFDPDEVVGRAHRRRRQRVMASISVAATFTVLAGVVITLVVGVPGDRGSTTEPAVQIPGVTCGSVDFDGSAPRTFPGAQRSIDRLNEVVPERLEQNVPGIDFEPRLGGLRTGGCAPTIMGSYQAAGTDWYLLVRLSREHDVYTPGDDRYGKLSDNKAYIPAVGVMHEEMVDGSRVRVYGDRELDLNDQPLPLRQVIAATRVDPDGLVVEVTFHKEGNAPQGNHPNVEDLVRVVSDRDLRF